MDFSGDLSEDEALSKFVKENQLRLVTEFTPEVNASVYLSAHNSKRKGIFDEELILVLNAGMFSIGCCC